MDSKRFKSSLTVFVIACCAVCSSFAQTQYQISDQSELAGADQLYRLASTSYSHQHWEDATKYFRSFVDRFPQDPRSQQVWFYLGESLVQLQQYDQARQVYQQYQSLGADEFADRTAFRIGECSYLIGENKTAFQQFESFTDSYPDSELLEFAIPYLGELQLQRGQPQEARQSYAMAIDRFPDSVLLAKYQLGLAQSLIQLDESDAARESLEKVLRTPDEQLVEHAALMLGQLEFQSENWGAVELALRALVADAQSALHLEAICLSCDALARQNKWSEIAGRLEPLLLSPLPEPWGPKVLLLSGLAQQKSENFNSALRAYDSLAAKWPEHPAVDDSLSRSIEIHAHRGNLIELEQAVEKLQQRRPHPERRAEALQHLGQAQYAAGRYADAHQTFQRLLALAPKTRREKLNRQVWQYLSSLCLIGRGRYPEAIELLNEIQPVVDGSDLTMSIAFARATALASNEQFEESLTDYQTVVQSNSNPGIAVRPRADYALALAKLKRLQESIAVLDGIDADQTSDASYLVACEAIAKLALQQSRNQTAARYFGIMALASDPAVAGRGRTGLIWTRDELSVDELAELVDGASDGELAYRALLVRAIAFEEAGDVAQAVQLYELIRNGPAEQSTKDSATLRLALAWQNSGNDDRLAAAAELFESFIDSQGQSEQTALAIYELAWLYLEMDRAQDSLTWFERISTEHADSEYCADALYRIAEIHRENGRAEDACEAYEHLIESHPVGALAVRARFALGEMAASAGEWHRASEHFVSLTTLTDHPEIDSQISDAAHYWLAESRYQSGDFERAWESFDQAKQICLAKGYDWAPTVWLRVAQIAAQREAWHDVEQILIDYRSRFSNAPGIYKLDYLEGRVLMSQALFREARESFANVINNPEASGTESAAMAQWMIGETYFHQENYHDAVLAYLVVHAIYDHPEWQSIALLQAGKCYQQQNQLASAEKTFRQLIREFPASVHTGEAKRRLTELRQ